MANKANPVPYIVKRESGSLLDLRSQLFHERLNVAKNLYRRDLMCHYGCVNAIEFSNNGELLVSGGDDRRVMLWQFGQAIMDYGSPEAMKGLHQSNIFCLGITSDNQRIFSGGNDDIVIAHDTESKRPVEVLQHQRAVCGLSIDPFNERVIATAGNDGRLLLFDTRQSVHESLVISRSRKAFHAVMFHPQQLGVVVSANARDGLALWDLRAPKHPALRYLGPSGPSQNTMSARFNASGSRVVALRRRLPPVLYDAHRPEPKAHFYHQDYYNSCTMKSCSFAGEGDRYVLSGSDDFNLYMWRVPQDDHCEHSDKVVDPPHIILVGHRSIVNQVRYNPRYCLIASSGVEKIIKVWSAMQYPQMRGELLAEAAGGEAPREMYSHEDYVSLVHHSGQYINHNYSEQSTSEDPRMMAFFDSLVQRELECLAEETDSLDGSSTAGEANSNASDSSDSDQILADFLPLPPKRTNLNGNRSQRCPNRLARLVASRYPKSLRPQKRGLLRRSKPCRSSATHKFPLAGGSRAAAAVAGGAGGEPWPRRHAARSAPSSERTDDDEPRANQRASARPLRRRINLTRAHKRKSKTTNFRKITSRSNGGTSRKRDMGDNNYAMNFNNLEENEDLPSTSTGYRGQSTSALFRIAEVDSDDDRSGSSPMPPRQQTHDHPPENLISIVPTPINGSRDSLADSLRAEPPDTESNPSPLPETRFRTVIRRSKRNGRISIQRSDSSESPPHVDVVEASTSLVERLSPKVGHNRTVERLMNETNESELESSCSTEGSVWVAGVSGVTGNPECGVGTGAGGSSSRTPGARVDISDNPDYQATKFRQRVKKARRNYRTHMDSDSN